MESVDESLVDSSSASQPTSPWALGRWPASSSSWCWLYSSVADQLLILMMVIKLLGRGGGGCQGLQAGVPLPHQQLTQHNPTTMVSRQTQCQTSKTACCKMTLILSSSWTFLQLVFVQFCQAPNMSTEQAICQCIATSQGNLCQMPIPLLISRWTHSWKVTWLGESQNSNFCVN